MNQIMRDQVTMPDRQFTPDDTRSFRDALGQFATGVTIITAQTPEGPIGITANSFSSVSLDPPLVLWSADTAADRHDPFVAADRFCINVLSAAQKDTCLAFAKEGDAFTAENAFEQDGYWCLSGALARFACTRYAVYPGGDHSIILGQVAHVTLGTGAPLVFHSGAFGGFARS